MSDSLWSHELHSTWSSPVQNTGVGSHSLLQGIFPTHGSNPRLLITGGFFIHWVTRKAQVRLFPLDFEPETFCMLGEDGNHYTTETRHSHQLMVLYQNIPLPSLQSSLRRSSWMMLFCFLKNHSYTSSTLAFLPHLPWQNNHMQNQNKLFNDKDMIFFFKQKPLRMGITERMDNLIFISMNINCYTLFA